MINLVPLGTQQLILYAIQDIQSQQGPYTVITNQMIADCANIDARTVRRNIRPLLGHVLTRESAGLYETGRGWGYIYYFNDQRISAIAG
jgi:hypothetical protein